VSKKVRKPAIAICLISYKEKLSRKNRKKARNKKTPPAKTDELDLRGQEETRSFNSIEGEKELEKGKNSSSNSDQSSSRKEKDGDGDQESRKIEITRKKGVLPSNPMKNRRAVNNRKSPTQ